MSGPPQSPASTGQIARSAGLIGVATMTSRVLGLVRDQVLAYLFGAGNAMDAFRIAFRIPNLLRDLFAEGAMSAAFVPTFTRYLTTRRQGGRVAAREQCHQRPAHRRPASWWLLGIVLAGPLVHLYAEDFARGPGQARTDDRS